MTGDDAKAIADANLPFKTMAGRWVFSQGAPTVLLCAILGFLGYGAMRAVPDVIDQLRAESAMARSDFSKQLSDQRSDFLEANKNMRDEFTRAIDKLADRIQAQK